MILTGRSKVLLTACTVILGAFVLLTAGWLFIPPSRTSTPKTIFVKKGMSLRKVGLLLEQEQVVRNDHLFVALATVLGKKGEVKAGEYEFHTRMLPLEVLNILTQGQVKRHLVTIPEGYTLNQIAQLLEELDIVQKQVFVEKASSPMVMASLGFPFFGRPTLEGYLFPDTYHLIKGMDPEEVIRVMIHQFKKNFSEAESARAEDLGLSEREIVILASIIEKETSLPEEKPLVSAVFHNRLRSKMPLQSDPTVIYGIEHFNGNLTKRHLAQKTPFNTYVRLGLPPTPICNPGRASLLAALFPAQVGYLYFVSKNDGSHHFSSNLNDHNRAVSQFQRKNNLTKK